MDIYKIAALLGFLFGVVALIISLINTRNMNTNSDGDSSAPESMSARKLTHPMAARPKATNALVNKKLRVYVSTLS